MNPITLLSRPMAMRHLVLSVLVLLQFSNSIQAQLTIPLNNSGQQLFALDPADHFLYVAQVDPSVHNLNVVNTLTNTVVGSTTYSGGYSLYIAANGTTVFWADQGNSLVRVFNVNGSGVPSAGPTYSANLATGMATLGATFAVSMQGGGDYMDIRNSSTGAPLFTTNLGGVAGPVFSDSNTNLYYARSTRNFQVIDATNGSIVRTLGGLVFAVDSSAAHNFVYMESGWGTTVLDQLTGATNTVHASYDFGAQFSDVAVNSTNGDIFVALPSLNEVVHLNSAMSLLGQYNVTGAQKLAFADNELFVGVTGNSFLTVVAIPEPSTYAAFFGLTALGFAAYRRRRRPAG